MWLTYSYSIYFSTKWKTVTPIFICCGISTFPLFQKFKHPTLPASIHLLTIMGRLVYQQHTVFSNQLRIFTRFGQIYKENTVVIVYYILFLFNFYFCFKLNTPLNLTNSQIPKQIEEYLSLGPKFAIKYNEKNLPTHKIKAHLEAGIQVLDAPHNTHSWQVRSIFFRRTIYIHDHNSRTSIRND